MKKNLINSLIIDSSNLVTFLNNSDDLLIMNLFVTMIIRLKKDLVREEELKKENG